MDPTLGINMFDYKIMELILNNLHNTFTDSIFPIITYLGEKGFIWILISVIMLCFKKSRKFGLISLASMAFCLITGEFVIKNLVGRVRPCNIFTTVPMLIPRPDEFSFPSGHTSSSFAAALAIFLWNKKAGCAAYVLAVLIGFSRMFLFVHFPTDIIAGAILGTLSTILMLLIINIIDKKTRSSGRRFTAE